MIAHLNRANNYNGHGYHIQKRNWLQNWYVKKQNKNIKIELFPAILDYIRLSLVIKGYLKLTWAISKVKGCEWKQERASYCYLKLFGPFQDEL